ncbi:hypothetical protein D3C86_1453010 [compost metagenome]
MEHCFGLGPVGVLVLGLGQRQRLHAAGDGNAHLTGEDALGRHTDTHQAGRAHAIQGHARHGIRQAAGVGAQAADVVGLGALLHGGAHDHVFHRARLDAGTFDHGTYHMAAEHRGFGVVERATERLGQRGARGGNDHNFIRIHGQAHSAVGLKV